MDPRTTKPVTSDLATPAGGSTTPVIVLEELEFLTDYRGVFAAGERLSFRAGVNLLVGDQGAGKSSLLSLVAALGDGATRRATREARAIIKPKTTTGRLVAFDFERDNPRTLSALRLDGGDATTQVAMRYQSHGEAVRRVLAELDGLTERHLILLDEPDTALSPRSTHELGRTLERIAARGHQLLVSVHNPIVIESQRDVFSLEHRQCMSAQAFLHSHSEPRA